MTRDEFAEAMLPVAIRRGRKVCRKFPHLADEAESIALVALAEVVCRLHAAHGDALECDPGSADYVRRAVVGRIVDELFRGRNSGGRLHRTRPLHRAADYLPDGRDDAAAFDADDAFRFLVRPVSPRRGGLPDIPNQGLALLAACFGGGLGMEEAYAAAGFSNTTGHTRFYGAIEIVRERALATA